MLEGHCNSRRFLLTAPFVMFCFSLPFSCRQLHSGMWWADIHGLGTQSTESLVTLQPWPGHHLATVLPVQTSHTPALLPTAAPHSLCTPPASAYLSPGELFPTALPTQTGQHQVSRPAVIWLPLLVCSWEGCSAAWSGLSNLATFSTIQWAATNLLRGGLKPSLWEETLQVCPLLMLKYSSATR